jgi:cellobiose phosphorylase
VPNAKTCEFWIIELKGGNGNDYELKVGQDIALAYQEPWNVPLHPECETVTEKGVYFAFCKKFLEGKSLATVFSMQGGAVSCDVVTEEGRDGEIKPHSEVYITKKVFLEKPDKSYVIFGAADTLEEAEELNSGFADSERIDYEKQKVEEKWRSIIERNRCELPDKRLQGFLNVWLKNQINLTLRYNRFHIFGYRDVLQDAWGHLFLNANDSEKYILEALSYMYEDGRCPRQYDRFSGLIDTNDFMDSPTWIPYAVCGYIKETGDFSLIDTPVGYYNSEKKDTVLDHILLSLDYLYRSRGKNGLILIRAGDWLDGMRGISDLGEATTVWGTIAAFNAQNIIAELCDRIGKTETAQMLRERSAEYKEIVNTVGWDGNWYTRAFIDDEPVGSHKCIEGKIYLNAQSWAIFSGICDDEERIKKIYRAISTYLDTPYGPELLAPAYTQYGKKWGLKSRPGTFANGAVYLHAASFKAVADCAAGNYEGAYDLLCRILPGHGDNCDARRTSEPYTVGNVYYGHNHRCQGMNLYTWFTATPSWLIHCGFDYLLGVSADYDGIRIEPHNIADWDEYTVKRFVQGTDYNVKFKKGKEKGIFVDGKKIDGNTVKSKNRKCDVSVIY